MAVTREKVSLERTMVQSNEQTVFLSEFPKWLFLKLTGC